MNYTQTIDQILKTFDFERARRFMEFDNWEWAHLDGSYKVPDVETIKKSCHSLLENAVKVKDHCFSGGFSAEYSQDGSLELKFVPVESWSYYYDKKLGFHLSFENDRKIVVQHIFPSEEVKVGSKWVADRNYLVEITDVDLERNELTYVNSDGIERQKDIGSFQSHYCLVLEDT